MQKVWMFEKCFRSQQFQLLFIRHNASPEGTASSDHCRARRRNSSPAPLGGPCLTLSMTVFSEEVSFALLTSKLQVAQFFLVPLLECPIVVA